MTNLMKRLTQGGHSLVLENGGTVYTFRKRGIADLYDLLQNHPELLDGASVADKVVGKGAAALMVLGHVKDIHTGIISEPALELLRDNAIKVTYEMKVSQISNRDHTGYCPVETLCLDCRTAEACLPQIQRFMKNNL